MAVAFENFEYSFENEKGKPVFVPTARTRRLAVEIQATINERFVFEPHYYHFAKGAHVAALHALREHRYFARLDLKNFFYSIGRNRVKAALKDAGIPRAEALAKWSTVRNPYEDPRYSLPYGFPQSPILATLVLRRCALGNAIEALPNAISKSVYLDDIAIASDDDRLLIEAYEALLLAVGQSGFVLNEDKTHPPAGQIDLFNCDLSYHSSSVAGQRVAEFYRKAPSAVSAAGFESYRAQVSSGNVD